MTLADGARNPTFMLQHEEGQNWRYSPSKKFLAKLQAIKNSTAPIEQKEKESTSPTQIENTVLIDPESLLKGAEDLYKLASNAQHFSAGKDSTYLSNLIKVLGYGSAALAKGFANTAKDHPILTGASLFGLASGVSKLKDKLYPEREINKQIDPSLKTNEVLSNLAIAAIPTIGGAAAVM
jgi:hypothetical protein